MGGINFREIWYPQNLSALQYTPTTLANTPCLVSHGFPCVGGKVMLSRKGVPRVVWRRERRRPKDDHMPDNTPTQFDSIPFLSVARSLGDFWSYSPAAKQFAVSPCPDIHCFPLSPKEQKFIVVASDGLWNVMSPKQVVEFIHDYENNDQTFHQPKDVVKAVINEALRRWKLKNLLADNIAVLIAFLTEEEYTYTPIPGSTSASSNFSSPTSLNKDSSNLKVITSSATQNSTTENTREDLSSPSQSGSSEGVHTPTSGVPVKHHTVARLRRNRQRNISSPPTRTGLRSEAVSEAPELPCSTLGKRQLRTDSSEASDMKRWKTDHLDSGLDVDTHTNTDDNIASQIESHTPVECSNETTNSVPPCDKHVKATSGSVDIDQTTGTDMEVTDVTAGQPGVPLRAALTKFDEDSSSGVSSDENSIGHVLKHTSNVYR